VSGVDPSRRDGLPHPSSRGGRVWENATGGSGKGGFSGSLSIEKRNQIASEYGTLRRRKLPPTFQRGEVSDGTSAERVRGDRVIAAPFERD
jgi:hypothetical protein